MAYKEKVSMEVERRTKNYVTKGFKIVFFILLGIGIAFLVGFLVMRLWNWLMPELFDLPLIGYWQAVGVLVLAKIIFGFGSGDGPRSRKKTKNNLKSGRCKSLRRDFSEWKHYDEFWNEEGEQAYALYVERLKKEK
ncbi:MAG: hypothetical protein ACJAWH_001317 [Maribacter sp.]|jgi:hypothetical protein